jgi:hypothetical protein
MLVIALHTGPALFTYRFMSLLLQRACAVHRLEVARDLRASRHVRHALYSGCRRFA